MNKSSNILIRDFDFKESYHDWLVHDQKKDISCLREYYEEYLIHGQTDFVHVESKSGFEAILWNNLDTLDVNPSFVLDYFRLKTIPMGYYSYMSDTKMEVIDGGGRVTYERHYLKPLSGIKPTADQELNYGNISFENCIKGNEGVFLKIISGRYPGKDYASFHRFIAKLLD